MSRSSTGQIRTEERSLVLEENALCVWSGARDGVVRECVCTGLDPVRVMVTEADAALAFSRQILAGRQSTGQCKSVHVIRCVKEIKEAEIETCLRSQCR